MTFPNDGQYEEVQIKSVSGSKDKGWGIEREDGWHFHIDANSPVEPKAGMIVRIYGKGIGYSFRGVYLDGQCVFYRTEDQDREYQEIASYGADAADWLARWDAGKGVWSIEMGGLGPGYEQCIQIVAAEIVRFLIDSKVDPAKQYEGDAWKALRDNIDKHLWAQPKISALGLSGAQAGAATSLATALYSEGPRKVLNNPKVQDRKIQVSKDFPSLAA